MTYMTSDRPSFRKRAMSQEYICRTFGVTLVTLSLVLVTVTRGAPVGDETGAMEFLKKYHYMGRDHPDAAFGALTDGDAFEEALKHYQLNMGMASTGVLDNGTMTMMSKPRCGFPDVMSMRDVMKRRRKRYTIGESRWVVSPLYYKFLNYSPKVNEEVIRRTVRKAFDAWSSMTRVKFSLVGPNDEADIEISFGAYDHAAQDQETAAFDEQFDGPGKTLAHAFYPIYGGNAHFDESEPWVVDSGKGVDLYFVALHELGHSLGLGHSTVPNAVMVANYPGYIPGLQLQQDDILGIQALYGTPPNDIGVTTTTVRTPPSEYKNAFCTQGTVDAVVRVRGKTLVFQGDLYAAVSDQGIESGYPRRIQDDWENLPRPVDAALELPNNMVVIFKGNQCWMYSVPLNGYPSLLDGFPLFINQLFVGLDVPSVDAAFIWGGNGRAYIFSDDSFYRLSKDITGDIDGGYPKPLEGWGLPGSQPFSDAYSSDNMRTYFFIGNQFYRYNDMKFGPDTDYPKPISDPFFGCTDNEDMEMEMPNDQFTGIVGVGPTMCIPGMQCVSKGHASGAALAAVFSSILICKLLSV